MNAKQIVNRLLEYGLPGNDEPAPEPEAQKTIAIGDIFNALPPGVSDQIMQALNTTEDTIELARQLKALLRPQAKALEGIGLIPDYTAYMLVAAADAARRRQSASN